MSEANREQELLEWIVNHFPQIEDRMPPKPVFMEFGGRRMFSSHDLPTLGDWLSSSGFPQFIKDPNVPDGFFACGIHSPAVSESLLVMWKEKDRYFWLYDMYVLYIAENSGLSVAATRNNLNLALARWNEGKQHVILLMGTFHEWDPDFW